MVDSRRSRSDDKWVKFADVPTVIGAVVVLGVAVPTAMWFHQLVSIHGISGALRFIWEGSVYHPRIRERMEFLDEVGDKIHRLESTCLSHIEDALRLAKSADESPLQTNVLSEAALREWEAMVQERGLDLRKSLAGLSDELDTYAANIDGVVSTGEPEVKARKKCLSSQVVVVMERVDRLVDIFFSTGSSSRGGLRVSSARA